VVALREDERRRLRRDLHDGLGPALAAIGLKAALARRGVSDDSTARGLLNEIEAEVSAGVADIRRLVEALRPPALDELGLVGAVRSRASAMAGDMSIDVIGSGDAAPLPAAVETAAFRIAVESVTNAVRHSNGRHCTVSIMAKAKGVELTVRDNGRGLKSTHASGVGLRSMSERAAEVGGVCSVRSLAEGGTLVHAWLPFEFGDRDDPADPRR
jgi:signal transduction histidine kinase